MEADSIHNTKQDETPTSKEEECNKQKKFLIIMVNSANSYYNRRKSIRRSWWLYKTDPKDSPLTPLEKERHLHVSLLVDNFQYSIEQFFVLGKKDGVDVSEEVKTYKDIVFVPVDDSYDNLARKTLEFMKIIVKKYEFEYFMHADDDSFVRMDLLLTSLQNKPKEKFYWGYIWNDGLRTTKPIRNPEAKSYMPYSQYPEDTPYPPFACGCGFVLTKDLVQYLASKADTYPDYRLVDVAFGMYLAPLNKEILIEDDPCVRPYRPLPLFKHDTIIQHYMKPEEFRGFWKKAIGKEPHDPDQQIPGIYVVYDYAYM